MPDASRLIVLLAMVALLSPLAAQEPGECFDAQEYDKATRTILCDCGCHPQSVHDCACGRAAEMRREIREEMTAECLDGDALVAAYVERYGDQIRIAPTATGFNLLAWVGPLVVLLAASLLMLGLLRRWQRRRAAEGPVAMPVPPDENDPYHERLRSALENLE